MLRAGLLSLSITLARDAACALQYQGTYLQLRLRLKYTLLGIRVEVAFQCDERASVNSRARAVVSGPRSSSSRSTLGVYDIVRTSIR